MNKATYSFDYPAPFGLLRVVSDDDFLLSLRWCTADEPTSHSAVSVQAQHPLLSEAKVQLDAYFSGHLRQFQLPFLLAGTPFQMSVWLALRDIPYGATVCYQELAVRLGCPGGSRAVGRACHENPLALVLPCHRVVGKRQTLTGYAGGIRVKQDLLTLEQRDLNHEKFLF